MAAPNLRSVLSWLAPGGLVALAAVLAVRFALDVPAVAGLAGGALYAVYAAAVLLAGRFHRSRVVAAVAAIAIAEQLLRRTSGPEAPVVYAAVALLLPATIGLLALAQDRGVLSLRGLAQLFGVLALPLVLSLLIEFKPDAVRLFLLGDLVSPDLTAWTSIPQPALLAYGVSLALTVFMAVRRGGPIEKGFAWALVATFLALNASGGTSAVGIYFLAAALTLGLSVVEISYSMAYRDELTRLPARRAMREKLAELGSEYSIAMIDVDHFKRVNDRHGHDVGDQVLRMVAARVKRVSGGGRAYRYGGEEFVVVFPGKSRAEAVEHLEKLRARVEEYGFALRGRSRPRKRPHKPRSRRRKSRRGMKVTVSIGVAERSGRYPTPDKVLRAADRALYKAKKGGRNRVCE
jgi:diguanylate cyclase (GGDEF)-like protein